MKVIWKTILEAVDNQLITLPKDAKFLHIHEQHEQICLWFECDSNITTEQRQIRIVGTGHNAPNGQYLGTGFLMDGQLVLHVYEIT